MAGQQDLSVERPAVCGSKTVVSYSDTIEFQIHWRIHDFSSLKAQTTPVYSDSVVVGTSAWRIKLVPLQTKEKSRGLGSPYTYVNATGIFLLRDSAEVIPDELGVEFKLSVQNDSDAKKSPSFEHGGSYGCNPYNEQVNCYGASLFEHTEVWSKPPTLVLDDVILNIRATVSYLPAETILVLPKKEVPSVNMDPLHKRFRTMFDSQLLQDFILVSSDKDERGAHRVLLAASSPVFSAMLQSGMKECKTGRYEMPDVSTDTLDAMLRFLYYNDMTHLKETARTVLVAADKYQVEDLKEACERILVEEIADDTAAGLLLLGDIVNGRTLKDAALRHVAVNLPKMTGAGQFTEVVEEGGKDLMKEVFEAVARWGYKQA